MFEAGVRDARQVDWRVRQECYRAGVCGEVVVVVGGDREHTIGDGGRVI